MGDTIIHSPIASLIFICTILMSLYGIYQNQSWNHKLMLHPYSIHRNHRLYTILSSGFIHADLNHLLFNMLSFLFFAFRLETIVGSIPFAIIYVGGIIFSDFSTIIKNKNNITYYSLGASGAISAVLFSYILFEPFAKIYLMFVPVGIPAYLFALLYLAYCVYASKKQYDQVNHEAHFWGAITGWIITAILFPDVFQNFWKGLLLQLQ